MDFAEKIEGDRIILERARPSFKLAEELLVLVEESRTHLLPWLPWANKNKTPEDEYAWLFDWCEKNWNEKLGYAYIIREKNSGKLLGSIDFIEVNETHKTGEIGYWLRSSAVGNGYMHEALLLLEKEGFKQGLNRIVIRNDPRNIRSGNVAERAGFHLDGVLRQDRYSDDEKLFADTNVWSKLKSEYKG